MEDCSMDWRAILQSLLSRAAWEVLLIIGGGTIIAAIKAKWPDYAPRILYGIAGATCIAVLLFTLSGRAILSNPPTETTFDNIESNLRTWCDNFGLAVQKQPENADLYFSYLVSPYPNSHILVSRTKQHGQFLSFRQRLTLPPDDYSALARLSKEQHESVINQMSLELARARVGFWSFKDDKDKANTNEFLMDIEDLVPITSSFTDYTLMKELLDVESFGVAASDAARISIRSYGR
jgi:hypothetical protein